MNLRKAFVTLLLVAAPFFSAAALQSPPPASFDDAVKLYQAGIYDRAREMFEQLASQSEDPMSEGYAILCAVALDSDGYEDAIEGYIARWGRTPLASKIYLANGYKLFDRSEWEAAASSLGKVSEKSLSGKALTELIFKKAWCDYSLGETTPARKGFEKVIAAPASSFTAPSHYAIGYMDYSMNSFADAFPHFEAAAKDLRFGPQASYYLLECKFMLKDYEYVAANGEKMFQGVPEERRQRLARILSESFLVLGNAGKAKKYFDIADVNRSSMDTADAFYTGSLQYSLGNYAEAIEAFKMMDGTLDAKAQTAAYQTGWSYIQIKDKVSAMSSFRKAAQMDFDARIKEDAFLNWSKLAFDLNHDASVFKQYLAAYPDSGRHDMIWDYIAVANLFNHDYAGAVAAYDNIDSLTPEMKSNYLKANYLRARQMVSKGSWRDAVPFLQSVAFFTPRQDNLNKLSRYWLAECNYKMGNLSDARSALSDLYNQSALDGKEEGARIPYDLAYCHFQSGEYSQAAQWFDRYIATGNSSCREDAFIRRADCDFLTSDYKEAVKSYGMAVAEFPTSENLYPLYQQGISYGLLGKKAEKTATLSKVSDYSSSAPFWSETMYELGRSYVADGKSNEARSCFETLLQRSTDSTYLAKSLIELGMIERNASRNNAALGYYKQVAEHFKSSPSVADALLAIESIYQSSGEPEKYLAYTESLGGAVRSATEKEAVFFNSAEQVFLAGNPEKALIALDKYLDNYPSGKHVTRCLYYKAESYKALDEKEKACDCYSKVLAASDGAPFREMSLLHLASLSYALEHYGESYSAYRSLLGASTIEGNALTAKTGMMRSAYGAHNWADVLNAALSVENDPSSTAALKREARYLRAKSLLSTSRREEAFEEFKSLAKDPSDDFGAESAYLVIQDLYDRGRFDEVEAEVYKFSNSAPASQAYYLAKSYIVLGDSFAEKESYRQARTTFESILNGYEPDPSRPDDILDSVRMRIEKLNKIVNN